MSDSENVTITLTAGQQRRIQTLTGRTMEYVELADPGGLLSRRLPGMQPREVEELAMIRAKQLNDEEAAERIWLQNLAASQDQEKAATRRLRARQKRVQRDAEVRDAELRLLAEGKDVEKVKKKVTRKAAKKRRAPAKKK